MNTMKKKVGPLPVYAYVGLATVLVLALYMRSRANANAATTDTTAPAAPSIDPTTGLPFAGIPSGSLGGGTLSPDTSGVFTPPTLAQEVGDVTNLIAALQGAGMITSPSAVNGLTADDHAYLSSLFGQTTQQREPDHSAPTPIAQRTVVKTAVSKATGKVTQYYRNSKGTLSPVPAGSNIKEASASPSAKANPTVAPTAVKLASGATSKIGAIVQKPSAAHGGALWDFRVNSNGTLTPVRKAA